MAGDGRLWNDFLRRTRLFNAKIGREAIVLLGSIYNIDEMVHQYNLADVVVGHGRGVMEAMSCAKPVIVIGKNLNGTIVNEKTVDVIAQYNFSGRHLEHYPLMGHPFDKLIMLLYHHYKLREELSILGRKFICHNYDVKIGAKKLSLLYTAHHSLSLSQKILQFINWVLNEFLLKNQKLSIFLLK